MPSQWFPDPSESATPQNRDTRISHNPNARTLSQPKIDFRNDCLNLNDFQRAAKKILSKELYEYVSSGTGDEQTLQENQLAFQRYFLRPRVMRSVGKVSTGTTLLGHNVSMPVFISPAGLHALCESEHGECATARAAAKAGILLGVSVGSMERCHELCSCQSIASDGSHLGDLSKKFKATLYQIH
jgi:FMN-dependent dehydrogenase